MAALADDISVYCSSFQHLCSDWNGVVYLHLEAWSDLDHHSELNFQVTAYLTLIIVMLLSPEFLQSV